MHRTQSEKKNKHFNDLAAALRCLFLYLFVISFLSSLSLASDSAALALDVWVQV
jgi:hypothetical protein